MLFNSLEFLVFLPSVFLLYWFVFRSRRWQNLLVVAASYVFYGWWDWRFLLLIAFTSLCSFGSGLLIEKYGGHRKRQKAVSAANIIVNLAILGVFKYYNFFVENLDMLFSSVGWRLDWATMNIILPVGISFYTFQALSYTIDVYQKKLPATQDLVEFFAYISFFPQLVAGPIERATHLLPQFQRSRSFDYVQAVDGCRQMLWGFFKKVVIADNCAYYADIAFDNHSEVGSLSLLLGAFFFTIQIYGDFSGYSSIAIGCAKLFGIKLQTNFKVPYFSRDVAEFWKRWHISLNKWFVDYVYIPLGGNRVSKSKVVRNIFVIFLLSGLWHGANWTYVTWGAYHACLFVPLILLNKNHRYDAALSQGRALPTLKELANMCLTFVLVMVGWIVFRATSIEQACEYVARMVSLETNSNFGVSLRDSGWLFGVIPLMFGVEWKNRNAEHEFHRVIPSKVVRYLVYVALVLAVYFAYMMSMERDNEFIYFQF